MQNQGFTQTNHTFQHLFNGLDVQTPTLAGVKQRYINFDNAASTPPLQSVQAAVDAFMQYYSSVHRGTGFKSQISTHLFEQSRQIVSEFLGADPAEHTVIFVKNTTEAINKLARRFPFSAERNIVLTTAMEHHSNDLPWREHAEAIHIALTPTGELDEGDFDRKLAEYGSRVALVAITGASNVTGFLNPVDRLAEKAHGVGAYIAVDCAQLAPHRKVNMKKLSHPAHYDFVAISAHKMYAPYGGGALVGRRDLLHQGVPDMVGGGTVSIVTLEDVVWAGLPDRDEAGSPNTAGAIALAAAIRQLEAIGMDVVAQHEAALTHYALSRLAEVPGVQVYGSSDLSTVHQRLGVIPFNLRGMSHFLVAAILGHEFAIGVRNGCFCAHPYILHLLHLSKEEQQQTRSAILAENKEHMPGLIRISFGLYNTTDEIDILIEALLKIVRGDYTGVYHQDIASGEYHPQGWAPDFDAYFRFVESP